MNDINTINANAPTELAITFGRGKLWLTDPILNLSLLDADRERFKDNPDTIALANAMRVSLTTSARVELVDQASGPLTATEVIFVARALLQWGDKLGKSFAPTQTSQATPA